MLGELSRISNTGPVALVFVNRADKLCNGTYEVNYVTHERKSGSGNPPGRTIAQYNKVSFFDEEHTNRYIYVIKGTTVMCKKYLYIWIHAIYRS